VPTIVLTLERMSTYKNVTTDAGIFLWMTYQAMSQAGLDCAAIFASVGMYYGAWNYWSVHAKCHLDPEYARRRICSRNGWCFWSGLRSY